MPCVDRLGSRPSCCCARCACRSASLYSGTHIDCFSLLLDSDRCAIFSNELKKLYHEVFILSPLPTRRHVSWADVVALNLPTSNSTLSHSISRTFPTADLLHSPTPVFDHWTRVSYKKKQEINPLRSQPAPPAMFPLPLIDDFSLQNDVFIAMLLATWPEYVKMVYCATNVIR